MGNWGSRKWLNAGDRLLQCAAKTLEQSVQEKRQKESARDMKKESDFPFERARRVTPEENLKFRQAIFQQFGIKLRNRNLPAQNDDNDDEKYELIVLNIHPKVLAWAIAPPNLIALSLPKMIIF